MLFKIIIAALRVHQVLSHYHRRAVAATMSYWWQYSRHYSHHYAPAAAVVLDAAVYWCDQCGWDTDARVAQRNGSSQT